MVVSQPVAFEVRTPLLLPLVTARVEAGFPSPAEDHVDQALDLNEHLVSHPAATFFVRVKGNSMKDANILSGDLLIVDRSVTPGDKQIVVAMLDGEFCVKRLRRSEGRVWLEAANPEFPQFEITDEQELTIWGAVTFIVHQAR